MIRVGWAGHALLLLMALGTVASVVYLPHMDTPGYAEDAHPYLRLAGVYRDWSSGERDDYEHFMHVDETAHWARLASFQREDTLRVSDPFRGEVTEDTSLSLRGLVHERGFYAAFLGFQEMTGIGWADMVRFFPAVWAMVTASLVWVALRPWPGAPLAAAFVALVPTSPRFLGIGFFVPIGLGLAWLACVLALSRQATMDRRVLLLVSWLGVWAFFIHLIAGFAVVLVLLTLLPLQYRGERRNLVLLMLGLLVPLFWFYDAFTGDVASEVAKFEVLPLDFTVFDQMGVPFLIAWGLSVGIVSLRPPVGAARVPVLSATLAGFFVFSMIVVNVAFDLHRYVLYDRWHQPFALFAAVTVAYGIVSLFAWARAGLVWLQARQREGHWLRHRLWTGGVSVVVVTILAGTVGAAVAAEGVSAHLDEPYYRVLSDEDWRLFTAAADIGAEREVFLTHPWKAPVYNALTGKEPHTWLRPGHPPINGADYAAYKMGRHTDGVWLVERDISIILDATPPDHPAYELHPSGAWVLSDAYAERLHGIRQVDG